MMERREISWLTAQDEIHDGNWFWLPDCQGIAVVAAMGSALHGLNRERVAAHNAAMAELTPKADILLANTRIEEDPTRTKYMREVWIRDAFHHWAYLLCIALNHREDNSSTWQIREEGEWTIIYSGDPELSPEGIFSTFGERNKTERLVEILIKVAELIGPPTERREHRS